MTVADPSRPWAVVTGASRGIGAAVARRLSSDGYGVALVARNEEALAVVQAEIEADGGLASVHRCDLADRAQLERLIDSLRQDQQVLHVLVNNAGAGYVGAVATQGGERWDMLMEVNLRAPFELIRNLEDQLARSGSASVVNVGSTGGLRVTPGTAGYSAAKAALHHLTHALAVEYGPRGIRVNAVVPGAIRTDMFERGHPPERKEAIARGCPLGRVGTPEEVASVVSFLCSAESGYVSGAIIPVDGATSCRSAAPPLI